MDETPPIPPLRPRAEAGINPGARAPPFAVPWRRTLPPPLDCFVARAPRNDGVEVGSLVSWRCLRLSLGLFRQPPPAFEHCVGCRALLGPGQRLRGGIDLVVLAGVRKQHEFGEMIGQPMGGLGKMDEAVLDCRGLREEAHDLVAVVIAEGIARRSRRNEIPLGVGCFDLHLGAIAPGFASVLNAIRMDGSG
jgi:hypothetical protein